MDEDNGTTNNNEGQGSAANAAGALFTLTTLAAFLNAYWHDVARVAGRGLNHVRLGYNWFTAWREHEAVVWLRRKIWPIAVALNLGHVAAMILVTLEYETLPDGFWIKWLVPLAVLDGILAYLMYYAWPVERITNYNPEIHGDAEAFQRAFGPNGRSPVFILGTLCLVLIFGGFLFFVPYTLISLAEGQWWFNIPACWLGLAGMAYAVAGVAIMGASIKTLAVVVGGTFSAVLGLTTLIARNAAAAGTITVTAENAERMIHDYSQSVRNATNWLGGVAGTPAVPVLIVALYWLLFPHPYTPLVMLVFLVGSGGWDFIYANRALEILKSQQKKVLASGKIWNISLMGALILNLLFAFRGPLLSAFANMFSMSWVNYAILSGALAALLTACVWGAIKLHGTWSKQATAASQPIAPSGAVILLGLAAFLIGIPTLGLGSVGVARAMGYSVHQSASTSGPTELGKVTNADGTTNTFTLVSNAPTATATSTSTTNAGTSTSSARSNTRPSTSGRVKNVTKRSDRIDPAFQ